MKVFQMNECDWYMAESAEQARIKYARDYDPGDDSENQPRESKEFEMNSLMFIDEGGADLPRSFAEELKIRLKKKNAQHGLFASTEY